MLRRRLLALVLLTVTSVAAGGCRSCDDCHDYDPPVTGCDCGGCGQRTGSACACASCGSGGYDSCGSDGYDGCGCGDTYGGYEEQAIPYEGQAVPAEESRAEEEATGA
jgi:hypothetical protein